jgi:hypothetical protein
MFKKFAVQTQSRLVRDPNTGETTAEERDPMETVVVVAAYAEIVKDVVTHSALTIGAVYTGCMIIRRICK